MKMDKIFAVFALVCALGFGAGVACAQPDYPTPLTPEQQAKAQQIFSKHYAAMEGTRQALAGKRAELDNELASPTPNQANIERLSREIGELRGKMLSGRIAMRADLEKQGLSADLYSPDAPQRGRWDDRPEVWRHGRHHWRGHGWGPGWGGMMGPRGCWNGCW